MSKYSRYLVYSNQRQSSCYFKVPSFVINKRRIVKSCNNKAQYKLYAILKAVYFSSLIIEDCRVKSNRARYVPVLKYTGGIPHVTTQNDSKDEILR